VLNVCIIRLKAEKAGLRQKIKKFCGNKFFFDICTGFSTQQKRVLKVTGATVYGRPVNNEHILIKLKRTKEK